MRSRILEFEAEFSCFVMPGLDPGIHVLLSCCCKDVDGRVKPGHDGWSSVQTPALFANPAFPLRRKTLYGAARFAVSEGV
jgi:hypothetical protein